MRLCCQGPLVEVLETLRRVQPAINSTCMKKSHLMMQHQLSPLSMEKRQHVQQGDLTHPFFTSQMPIVLENSGKIDPERIQSYIAADGYQALYHVLREMTPSEVVDTITRSGLRGRGGAGYPTGLKWATVAKCPSRAKICDLQC